MGLRLKIWGGVVVDAAWTEERIARLVELWKEGVSASRIAAELGGITRNAVVGKVYRLGLQRHRRVIDKRARSNQNMSRRRISKNRTVPILPQEDLPSDEIAGPDSLSLLELGLCNCRWPVGKETGVRQLFCGADAGRSVPYCKRHLQVAARPGVKYPTGRFVLPGRQY